MEAKKQVAGEEDLSMEEILQSIRRIIADDDESGKTKPAASNGASASNILELTDMVEEDGTVTNLKDAKKTDAAVDVLKNIDAALVPEVAAQTAAANNEVKPEVAAPTSTSPFPEIAESKPNKEVDSQMESLLSKTTEAAALSALSKLNVPDAPPLQTTPSPEFRSGSTVEDLVEELLTPVMKDWLNKNLPAIVERIVEREVMRLTRR